MSGPRRKLVALSGRFAAVGALTAALHYGVLYALVQWAALDSVVASSLGFAVAVGFNYLMHYHWTFAVGAHAEPIPHGRALARYAAMIGGGFLLNGLVMYAGTELLGWHYLLAQLLALGVVITWNFILASGWVFRS